MICRDTHFQRGISHLQMHSHGTSKGTDNRGETYFSVGSNPRERGHGGTRLCRWDKLTTGPRWWDTTWIIRPSTHNCVALSGRTGSFESWYLQHARFRRNRAEIRKRKMGATITFAISHANKTRAVSAINNMFSIKGDFTTQLILIYFVSRFIHLWFQSFLTEIKRTC